MVDALANTDSLKKYQSSCKDVHAMSDIHLLVRAGRVQQYAVPFLDRDGADSCIFLGNTEYTLENGLKACLVANQHTVEGLTIKYIRSAS